MSKVQVQVMYPQSKEFDWGYYISKHMAMVEEKMDVLSWTVLEGIESITPPTYQAIASMIFENNDSFKNSFAAVGEEMLADIPKYTDATPIIQVSEFRSSV